MQTTYDRHELEEWVRMQVMLAAGAASAGHRVDTPERVAFLLSGIEELACQAIDDEILWASIPPDLAMQVCPSEMDDEAVIQVLWAVGLTAVAVLERGGRLLSTVEQERAFDGVGFAGAC